MGIFVSVVTPSKELEQSKINKAITDLAVKIYHLKRAGHMPALPKLDISFLLATELDYPDFQGMRMGGDGEDQNSLYCEVAVPLEIIDSSYASDYVAAILFDAIDNADEFFAEMNGIPFDKKEWLAMAMSLVNDERVPEKLH